MSFKTTRYENGGTTETFFNIDSVFINISKESYFPIYNEMWLSWQVDLHSANANVKSFSRGQCSLMAYSVFIPGSPKCNTSSQTLNLAQFDV